MMKISGYTTTRNCINMKYPFRESIECLLKFCDEVVVADSSDGSDATLKILTDMMDEHENLNVVHVDVDYSVPNFGVWDGKMKAIARENCTGDFLFQSDVDEFHLFERSQIEDVIKNTILGNNLQYLVALPVVEFWGSEKKVRIDVNSWKWRVSKNDPNITHGAPKHLRQEINGLQYFKPGTDGCDYIFKDSGINVNCLHFITEEYEFARHQALKGDFAARKKYEKWFNNIIKELPTTYHFSWFNIENKIKQYQKFWNKFWISLYGEQYDRPEGWNPFFEEDITKVSDEQILICSKALSYLTGGHIFHTKWDFRHTPWIELEEDNKISKSAVEMYKMFLNNK